MVNGYTVKNNDIFLYFTPEEISDPPFKGKHLDVENRFGSLEVQIREMEDLIDVEKIQGDNGYIKNTKILIHPNYFLRFAGRNCELHLGFMHVSLILTSRMNFFENMGYEFLEWKLAEENSKGPTRPS